MCPHTRYAPAWRRVAGALVLTGAAALALTCSESSPVGPTPVDPTAAAVEPATPSAEPAAAPVAPAATANLSVTASAGDMKTICHQKPNTKEYMPIHVRNGGKIHPAPLDGEIGSAVPGQPGMKFSSLCTAVPMGSITIGFDELVQDGAPFTTIVKDGFTIRAQVGDWIAMSGYGNPMPAIILNRRASQPTLTGTVQVISNGADFTFESVDVYSSTTPIPYVFTGFHGGTRMVTLAAEVPNTYGEFVTVPNDEASDVIDILWITLSNPAGATDNPVGLDNVVLTYRP